MADAGSSDDAESATLTALTDCVTTVLQNDITYGLCVTNSGLFDLIPSEFLNNNNNGSSSSSSSSFSSSGSIDDDSDFTGDSPCRVMCSKMSSSASASCCDAAASLRACNTTSSAVTTCKELFDSVFTYQNECDGGISSANTILIVVAVIVAVAVAAVAIFSRLYGRRNLHTGVAAKVAATWRQITNLVWKNMVLRRRRPVSLVMELFLPVLLSTALLILANLDNIAGGWRSLWITSEAAVLNETLICSDVVVWGLEVIGGPSSTMTSFYTGGQSVLGLFFLVSYIKFVSTTTTTMVIEKENRLREVMKIMGLSDATLLCSWCLTTAVLATPLAFAISAELKYGNVFPTTEYATLVFLFWSLSVAITAFSYFVAPFFNKSRTAAIASVLLWLILFFPYFAVQSSSTNAPKYWAALSPPTAFALAVDEILRRAQLGTGFAYSVGLREEPVTVPSAFRMSLFLILDSVILVALGWYLEQVLPQQYGVRKPWYFLFTKSFWFNKIDQSVDDEVVTSSDGHASQSLSPQAGGIYTQLTDGETVKAPESGTLAFVEPVNSTLAMQERNGTCLQIRRLRKVFPLEEDGEERVAVDDVDLSMYSGQITALLGHNGAGKTTIISMLTGLIPPTAGDATLYGCSIKRDFHELRRVIGICPQHDVLFQDLTVEEHLLLFATMKHVPRGNLQASVDKMIDDVGLTEIRHALAKTLSGGQKRKLSVALAFLGGSKLVFLDEPTSGMDPYSRRFTWNLLQQSRDDRVIVLTTHFMDEADILGDRIAILADGKLRCAGSSLFLKNRFGAGYNLTMIKSSDGSCDANTVEAFLKKYVPGVKCLSSSGSELVFQLPTASSEAFPTMLECLDAEMHTLGVQQYGISVTTLEEVFLRISQDHEEELEAEKDALLPALERKPSASLQGGKLVSGAAVDLSSPSIPITEPSMWAQYVALTKKRFQIATRDKKTLAYSVGIPLIFLIILAVLPEIEVADFIPNYASSLPTEAQQSTCSASTNFTGLVNTNYNVTSCFGSRGFDFCTLGVVNCDVNVCCDAANIASPWYPCNTCNSAPCFNSNCLAKTNAKLQVTLNGFLVAIVVMLAFAFIPAAIVAFVVREKDPIQNAKSLQLISGANVSAYWMASWTHDILVTIVPIIASAIIIPLSMTPSGADKASTADVFAIIALVITHVWAIIPLAYLFSRRYVKHAVAQTALLVFALGTGGLLSIFSFMCRIVNFTISGSLTLSSLDRNYLRWIFMIFPGYTLNNGIFELATRKVSRRALFGSGRWVRASPSFFGLFEGLGKEECIECWDRITPSCCVRQPFDLEIIGAPLLYTVVEAILLSVLVFVLENRSVKWKQQEKIDSSAVAMEMEEEDDDVKRERFRVEQEAPRSTDLVFIRNLRQQYAGKPRVKVALKDLCLSVQSGECFGYLGINGAGKSTTMAVLTGQLAPTQGFVTLSGFDLATSSASARKTMGYCPQFDALHDLLTVKEQLQLYARIKGIPEAFVDTAVDEKILELGLAKYRDKLTQGLSGGNKRKVSTAIALLGRPRVVFLDEPSTGVDPSSRRKMWDVIARVCSSDREDAACVVLTTHSMEECEALCSRVGILVSGRLKCLGSVEHLKQKFGRGYTVEITLRDPTTDAVELKMIVDQVRAVLSTERSSSTRTSQRQSSSNLQVTGVRVTSTNIQDLCIALGAPERGDRVLNRSGTGWLLSSQLEAQGSISVDTFSSWWVSETHGEKLQSFVYESFPGSVLAEQQGEHFRFQVPKHRADRSHVLRPAEIFRALEKTRTDLNVDEYSVSETALEHIFNNMAAQQDEEKGVAHGMNVA
ncbi:ABC transporter A family member 5 [Phytophthora citrophthora]|uniref:ABC transporter A family member 5 n=1 Tax=Phytophthora citrophthora TaxID=4793 RepID=A0AAD9GRT1_9STRA|nr:ABC transporter A family member 5 [Phytophthora citrophthora]